MRKMPPRRTKRASSSLVSIKLPPALATKVSRLASQRGTTRSEVIRSAIEGLSEDGQPSVGSLTSDLCGMAGDAPADLSTNRRHFEKFGR